MINFHPRDVVCLTLLCLAFCTINLSLLRAQPPLLPLIDLYHIEPSIILDIRYFTDQNFVGQRVDGYEAPRCLLSRQAALALKAVQQKFTSYGLSLKVFDCYRPQRAVDHFVRWAHDLKDLKMKFQYYPRVDKNSLFSAGYIAARSGHSRGSTVDLTIEGLDMGTSWDFFGQESHTLYPHLDPQARANRMLLVNTMRAQGFVNYDKEWWHFTWQPEVFPHTYFNAPISTDMTLIKP